jgi:nucleotide-binding universal stress UspA family protein
MSDTLVLGYDESPSANAALAATIELARELKANVIVVFGYYISPLGGQGAPDLRAALERLGEHALGRAVADLEAAGISATTRLLGHRPADAILDVAKETDARMIVVGTEGENPITGAFLGSVVLKLVQRSKLPLVVVPTTEP